MGRLSDSELQQRLSASPWQREGEAIVREWKFENFERAMVFANLVAEEAEGANHHPDILVHGWNKVRLTLSTHSEGGLTDSDFALAERIDQLA